MIKAIETCYKGYRFRSRLEARWAVFFDALDIKWEYETEGYDLGPLGWYLPDFFLPDISWWCEVKPRYDLIPHKDRAKMRFFDDYPPKQNDQLLGWGLIMLIGTPSYPTHLEDNTSDVGVISTNWFLARFAKPFDGDLVIHAVNESRSARFEHGERP